MNAVTAPLSFIPADQTEGPVQTLDLRRPMQGGRPHPPKSVTFSDARRSSGLGLHISGFELHQAPSRVRDFDDHIEVMEVYYEECRALARRLTGAHTAFTFDHIIREPGTQLTAGGPARAQLRTGIEAGGGYINSVHMDYTDNTRWERYLELHGFQVPESEHVYALNFWRSLGETSHDNPLAVCDARTVEARDLQEVNVYGYGGPVYSWYDIGIETFSVAASDRHRWYYYPEMTNEEVLIIKSFDSAGVIGSTPPHASFSHPHPKGIARRSIELRVLCFC